MAYDSNNVFAKILSGDIPCQKVYENDYVLAFRDIAAKRKEHVLVIPKKAYICFSDFHEKATQEEVAEFYKAVSKIAADLGLREQGYRLIANEGEFGGQEVPHYHMHILGGEPVGPMVA